MAQTTTSGKTKMAAALPPLISPVAAAPLTKVAGPSGVCNLGTEELSECAVPASLPVP